MDRKLVEEYFDSNSKAWITAGYDTDRYSYPTALYRMRRTLSILKEHLPPTGARIVDLGCGGGHLSIELARQGHEATGIDASGPMLARAVETSADESEEVRRRVEFLHGEIIGSGPDNASFDAVTALGVIGYQPNDDVLFQEASRLLKDGGLFIVSCRNRLFNMVSMSDYTIQEIEEGRAVELVKEIQSLFIDIPPGDALAFAEQLGASAEAAGKAEERDGAESGEGEKTPFTTAFARQHTPIELLTTAKKNGFSHVGYWGVHPHLLVAGLNKSFPPYLYNNLSTALESLCHLPVSLIWSSVFLGAFTKNPG